MEISARNQIQGRETGVHTGDIMGEVEELAIHGRVDGITAEQFAEFAKTAEATCPISNALRASDRTHHIVRLR